MTTPPQSEREMQLAKALADIARRPCSIGGELKCLALTDEHGFDLRCPSCRARAALAIEPEPVVKDCLTTQPGGDYAMPINELAHKDGPEPDGELKPKPELLSGREIANIINLLSENGFDTGLILRVAVSLQGKIPDAAPPPTTFDEEMVRQAPSHEDMNRVQHEIVAVLCGAGFDPCPAIKIAQEATAHAWDVWCRQSEEIARLRMAPPPEVLAAADVLAEAAKSFSEDTTCRDGCDCLFCILLRTLVAYRSAREKHREVRGE